MCDSVVYNKDKLRELVLYIARKSEMDEDFGATKLYKLLFFSDFLAYANRGRPITGATYRREEHGPVPNEFQKLFKRMERDGDATVVRRSSYGHQRHVVIASREPDLSGFSGDEIATVDQVIVECDGKNARQVSAFSHRFRGWKITREHENIPYFAVVLQRPPLSESDVAFAQRAAGEIGQLG